MAVKVDARIKEEYDPKRYMQNLKERLAKATACIKKLVQFIQRMGPEHWRRCGRCG